MSILIVALALVIGLVSGLSFTNIVSTGPHPFAVIGLMAFVPLLAAGLIAWRAERDERPTAHEEGHEPLRPASALFALVLLALGAAAGSFAAGLAVVFVLLPGIPLLAIMLPIVALWPRDHVATVETEHPSFFPHAPAHGHT